MTRAKLILGAVLLVAAATAFAADTRRSDVPTGLYVRQAAEKELRACYAQCKGRGGDATALERCMNECNDDYPLATSLQPKSERVRR